MKLSKEQTDKLTASLPAWAVKPHPSKTYLSVINPMAVIDRLNEVFGFGGWDFHAREIHQEKETSAKGYSSWVTASHGTLIVKDHDIHIEQFGGSDNADLGDAYKGSATDALTKCASYLGVGASIYKGQGNVEPPKSWTLDEALTHIIDATSSDDLSKRFSELSATMKKDEEVLALGAELRKKLTK